MHYFRPTIVHFLKENSVNFKCYFAYKKIHSYESTEPLKLAEGFKPEVSFNNKMINTVDFLVLEGEDEPI